MMRARTAAGPPHGRQLHRRLAEAETLRAIGPNAATLVATAASTALLGAGYWVLAARQASPEGVGIASAAISAMGLLAAVSVIGFNTLLVTELPRVKHRRTELISGSVALVMGLGLVAGGVFAVVIPLFSDTLSALAGTVGVAGVFACGVSLSAGVLVADRVTIGLFLGHLQLARTIFFSVTKLAALVAVATVIRPSGPAILTTWVFALGLSVIALTLVAVKRSGLRSVLSPDWSAVRRLAPAAVRHHVLNISVQVPPLVVPLVVTASLGARAGGFFFVAWMLADMLFVASRSLATAVHASSAAHPLSLSTHFRFTLVAAGCTAAAGVLVLSVIGEDLLSLLGSGYANHAATPLVLLALGAFPLIVQDHYATLRRLGGRTSRGSAVFLCGGAVEIAALAAGAHLGGLTGAAAGWTLGVTVKASLMVVPVWTAVRSAPQRVAPAPTAPSVNRSVSEL